MFRDKSRKTMSGQAQFEHVVSLRAVPTLHCTTLTTSRVVFLDLPFPCVCRPIEAIHFQPVGQMQISFFIYGTKITEPHRLSV